MRRVFTGTKVIDMNGLAYATVLSDSEYRSIVGRAFDQATDFAMAMNGDVDAANAPIKGTSYVPSTKSVIFSLDSARTGKVRINYVVVAR